MKAWLGVAVLSCAACSGATPAEHPSDGGVPDAHILVEAGREGGAPEDSGPVDASPDVDDASSEQPPTCTLASPTFNPLGPPPNGASLLAGASVTILPPPGFPADGEIFYTTTGAVPTPQNGTLYVAPIAMGFADGTQETVTAIAHDPSGGCADSLPATGYYNEDLPDACCSSPPPAVLTPESEAQPRPFTVTIGAFPGTTACYTLDGVTVPTCDPAGTCGQGSLTYIAGDPISIEPGKSSSQVTVGAILCAAGEPNDVPAIDQTYTLQLAPPYLASTNGAGAGLPGWSWSGTGTPNTMMPVPGDAGAPYGPFVAQQVGDLPCTSATNCTGAVNQLADFLCWSKNAVATCACAAPLPLTTATPYATLPPSANVQPGDMLSVIACQSSPPTNAPGVYAPSVVTTVHF